MVFFGPSMFWAQPGAGLVLQQWAHLATAAFWLVAALGFGLLTRRLRSLLLLAVFAVVFVAAISIAVRLIAPLFNVQLVMESI